MLRTWKLVLAYDGTDFQGWQIQPGLPTIQGELQAALGHVTGETPLPQGSGRTDAGVHALGQVASFQLEAPIPADNLRRALNRSLPKSIRVTDARIMCDATFHARHSAMAKTYEYRILLGNECPPFITRYVTCCGWMLNLELLQGAARMFEGEQDFRSFAAKDPERRELAPSSDEIPVESAVRMESTVRTVFSSAWEERRCDAGDLIVYRVRGNGFLHHMVRNLVGTMLEVGRGQLALQQIPRIIAACRRSEAGPTAPARGLFLHSVEYPPDELDPRGV